MLPRAICSGIIHLRVRDLSPFLGLYVRRRRRKRRRRRRRGGGGGGGVSMIL
jgi:hypothetical protein